MYYLLILPILYLLVLLTMQSAATPYWLWMNIDPSYFYLLNGLDVALGSSPADFHHPGTTTQLIAGIVLKLAHPMLSGEALTDAVLSSPEAALRLIARVDDVLIALSMLWAGFEARKVFGDRTVLTLLVQGSPFLSTVMLVNGYTVKPEATLIVAGSVLTALLCRYLAKPSARSVVGIGVVLGFAVVTKIHALSLFAIPLFVIGGRQRVILGVAALVSVIVFISPIAGHLGDLYHWVVGLASHNGDYGGGEVGILPDHYFWNAFKQLRRPIFSAPLLLGALVLWVRRGDLTSVERPLALTLAGVLLSQLLHLLLVAKHPISYYLIPAFLSMGLGIALTLTLARPLIKVSALQWRLGMGVLGVLLVVTQSLTIRDQIHNRERERKTSLAVDMTAFAPCTKINMDFASDPNFALMLGNNLADWTFKPWLSSHIPPDTLMWAPANGDPQQFDAVQIPWVQAVNRAACTVIRGAWGQQALATLKRALPETPVNACTNGDEWVLGIGIACESAFPGLNSTYKP